MTRGADVNADTHRRLCEIAKFTDNEFLICKSCAVEHFIEAVTIAEIIFKNHTKHYYAYCPDCNKYIKTLRQHAAPRIFDFGRKTLVAISDADTMLLKYYLDNRLCQQYRIEMEKALEARIEGTGFSYRNEIAENEETKRKTKLGKQTKLF